VHYIFKAGAGTYVLAYTFQEDNNLFLFFAVLDVPSYTPTAVFLYDFDRSLNINMLLHYLVKYFNIF